MQITKVLLVVDSDSDAALAMDAARASAEGFWGLEYRETYPSPAPALPGASEPAEDGLEFARLLLRQYEGSVEARGDGLLARFRVRCENVEQGCR
jgi:hypothetical protein